MEHLVRYDNFSSSTYQFPFICKCYEWNTLLRRLDTDGKIKKKTLKERGCVTVQWIQLIKDRIHWQVLVNIATNIQNEKFFDQLCFSRTVSGSQRVSYLQTLIHSQPYTTMVPRSDRFILSKLLYMTIGR